MDSISELLNLLYKYGHAVRMIPPEASHHNYPYEISHAYIGEEVHSLMEGHDITLQLCPYALSHYIKVYGMVPHKDSDLSPDDYILGTMLDASVIRSLG